jgi:hypothetical protein
MAFKPSKDKQHSWVAKREKVKVDLPGGRYRYRRRFTGHQCRFCRTELGPEWVPPDEESCPGSN